jgi:hypothetical protein
VHSHIDGYGLVKEHHQSFTRQLAFNDDYRKHENMDSADLNVVGFFSDWRTNLIAKVNKILFHMLFKLCEFLGRYVTYFWHRNHTTIHILV